LNHNIVEKDGDLAIRFVKKEEVEKPITECSDKEKIKNDIVEKDGKFFLNVPKEKIVK
jgi:hypothetical protein